VQFSLCANFSSRTVLFAKTAADFGINNIAAVVFTSVLLKLSAIARPENALFLQVKVLSG
jgi:hypothetical protein